MRTLGVGGVRALAGRVFETDQTLAKGVTAHEVQVDGPHGRGPTRIYVPVDRARRLGVHVHIHAGGYVIEGGLGAEQARLSGWARDLDCVVVAPDFRLPPEHRFSTGVEDCWAVVRWCFSEIERFGGDPARIGIGGGCTGGVVSAVMALMARDAGLRLSHRYMAATVTDTRERYRSYEEFAEGYTLTEDTADFVTELYLCDELDRYDWRASPILASSVKHLPPTLVVEGEADVLHDEAQAWADRLRDADVEVTFRVFPEEGHSLFPHSAAIAEAEFIAFVRQRLDGL